jgi:hypothetical protein
MFKRIFHGFVLLALLAGVMAMTPAQSAAAKTSSKSVSPEGLLNPDGTLNLSGSSDGSLDLSGWNVQIDPQRGPMLTREEENTRMPKNLPSVGNWENLGGGVAPFNGMVYAIAVSGTDVYVGGDFVNLDGILEADYIARWDGSHWHALGSDGASNGSVNNSVYAITVDGTNLYVGGSFTDVNNSGSILNAADYIARWDGSNWNALGVGIGGNGSLSSYVMAIAVDGNYVYAGGAFLNVKNNGIQLDTADYIAEFSKSSGNWLAMGSNGGNGALNGDVFTLAINDSGLYVGGAFLNVAGISHANFIAKWNGSAWNALGDCGVSSPCLNSSVNTIALKGSGALTQVWVGGNFNIVLDSTGGAIPGIQFIAFFDGADWGAITSGSPINSPVNSIQLGAGNVVYIAGEFTNADGIAAADYVAKLTGTTWSAMGDGGPLGSGAIQSTIETLAVNGSDVYIGGNFTARNGITLLPTATNFAHWDGSNWSGTGSLNGALNASVNTNNAIFAIATIGADVYVGGNFHNAAGIPEADYVARWDGSSWSALGSDGGGNGAIQNVVYTLAAQGTDLYVGGIFTAAAGIAAADGVARWDTLTSSWSALGGGIDAGGYVYSIAVDGMDVYVGGFFNNAGGIPEADSIAKWDAHFASWSALGNSGPGSGPLNNAVNEIAAQNGNLYVTGLFTNAAGLNATDYVAKWDGANWSALGDDGSGDGALKDIATAIAINGANVYVGGYFLDAAGIAQADHLAVWNGANWSAVGGVNAFPSSVIYALAANGLSLYAGGGMTDVNGIAEADYIVKWDGSTWSALGNDSSGGGSLTDAVETIHISSANNAVYIGGWFQNVNNNGSLLTEADFVAAYGADLIPPLVSSIIRADTNPTAKISVDFTVTFSEAVTGVDSTDFSLTTSGVSGATVSGISGSGSSYTLTVKPGTGNGTVRLDVKASGTNIIDGAGNPLNGGFTSGEVYTVKKSITLKSTGAQDGWMLESGENTNLGGVLDSAAATLRLGDDMARKQYRSILSFATGAALPDTAVITKVTLKVRRQGVTGGGNPVSTFQGFLVDIRKASFGTTALQVADWQSTANKTLGPLPTAPVSGWYVFNLNAAKAYVNKLASGSGLTQIRLRFKVDDNNDAIANYLSLYSGNAGAASRPQLIVEYYVP